MSSSASVRICIAHLRVGALQGIYGGLAQGATQKPQTVAGMVTLGVFGVQGLLGTCKSLRVALSLCCLDLLPAPARKSQGRLGSLLSHSELDPGRKIRSGS